MEAFEDGKGDFADDLIREQALGAGCREVATFNADLHAAPEFVSP